MDSVVTSPSVDVDLKMDYSLLLSKIAVSKYIAPQAALSLHRKSEVNFASTYPRLPKRHDLVERATYTTRSTASSFVNEQSPLFHCSLHRGCRSAQNQISLVEWVHRRGKHSTCRRIIQVDSFFLSGCDIDDLFTSRFCVMRV
jgi:hypothetical protein